MSLHVPLGLHLLFKLLLQAVVIVLCLSQLRRDLQLLTCLLSQQLLRQRSRSVVSVSVLTDLLLLKFIGYVFLYKRKDSINIPVLAHDLPECLGVEK